MARKNISWNERKIVAELCLDTPNNSYPILVGWALSENENGELSDSFSGRIVMNDRVQTLPKLSADSVAAEVLEGWNVNGEKFAEDYQRENIGGGSVTRFDRTTWSAKVDVPEGDRILRVSVIFKQNADGDAFPGSVTARYLSDGQRGAKKAPTVDASAL